MRLWHGGRELAYWAQALASIPSSTYTRNQKTFRSLRIASWESRISGRVGAQLPARACPGLKSPHIHCVGSSVRCPYLVFLLLLSMGIETDRGIYWFPSNDNKKKPFIKSDYMKNCLMIIIYKLIVEWWCIQELSLDDERRRIWKIPSVKNDSRWIALRYNSLIRDNKNL